MTTLHGATLTRTDIERRCGALGQLAGVRLMTLGDGLERGIRMLEFRSGTGLRFTVLVDRAMDIADCDHNGRAIGWHSPAGFRHPGLHEPEGEGGLGWQRSFSGLLVTCGLDHILFMDERDASSFNYSPKTVVKNSVHGRVSAIPARLTGYGERWEGNRCFLWCEGVVSQGTVFGEHLEMRRRIEIEIGTDVIRLHDDVTNRGFYETPHMFCYHINLSYPLLDAGAEYVAPITDVVWAAHEGERYEAQGVGYREMVVPQDRFHEQVWQHGLQGEDDGRVSVALLNDALGLGFELNVDQAQFPCMYEWQNFQAGQYALGMEPSTHHVLGASGARARGEEILLVHGDTCSYRSEFRILADANAVADARTRIRACAQQPDGPYPIPSHNFAPLRQAQRGQL
ncbi:aldose 1-epimerase family protein [Sphingomonas sp. 1P08PE]|uniref:aldose 1-epimerase family protein n=1 Tax=Sphingomonas sp. 1P08PE TaxID=554122 RepID=UPI00399F1DEB